MNDISAGIGNQANKFNAEINYYQYKQKHNDYVHAVKQLIRN